ncbi:DUF2723 domain-containing protein [bacterium]|nr:DUF2723 domain-containing protein [bacterium]
MDNLVNRTGKFSALDIIFGVGVFCISFAVYFVTLCPTIFVGDSGELTAAALTCGIAHPPGYPLYVIVSKIFSLLLPGESSAYEINMFSAFCGSLSVFVFYFLMRLIGVSRFVCAATALTFGFLNLFWGEAVVARVYTLSAFLILCSLFYLLRYKFYKNINDLYRYFVFFGLGLANHTIAVITIVPAGLIILASGDKKVFYPKTIIKCILSVLPGLSFYLFLPLRSLTNPVINWGNPGKGMNLLDFILRKEYWDRVYVKNMEDTIEVVTHYILLIPREFLYAGIVFLVIGLVNLFIKKRITALSFILIYVMNIFVMILHASRADIFYWPRYIIPAFISLCVFFGYGLDYVIGKIAFLRKRDFTVLIFPLLMLYANYHINDRSRNYMALDYNMHILNNLPENANLVAQGDNVLFPLTYLHYVKKIRTDVKMYEMGMNELAPFEFNPKDNPTFFTHYNDFKGTNLSLVPTGLVYQALTPDMRADMIKDWDKFKIRPMEPDEMYLNYNCRCMLADYYFMIGVNKQRESFKKALSYYEKACRIAYDNDVVHYNAGLVYLREGLLEKAREMFRLVIKIDRKNNRARNYINSIDLALKAKQNKRKVELENSHQTLFQQVMDKAGRAFKSGDISSAFKYINEALKSKPDSINALSNLATLYILSGDYDNARKLYLKILKLQPENIVARKNIVWLTGVKKFIYDLNMPEDSTAVTDEEKNKFYNALIEKSDEVYKRGDFHESIFYLKRAVDIFPERIAAYKKLIDVYVKLNVIKEALLISKKVYKIEPDDSGIREIIGKLERILESL